MEKDSMILRNKISFLLIGVYQGLSLITSLAIQFFMSKTLHIGPSLMSTIQAIIKIPNIIRPFFGFLTDFIPICGYKRKIYLLIASAIMGGSWSIMTFHCDSIAEFVFLMIFIQLGTSFAAVLGEAELVSLSYLEKDTEARDKASKSYSSLYSLCMTIGFVITAYPRGELLMVMTVKQVFFIGTGLTVLIMIAGLVLKEKTSNDKSLLNEEELNTVNQSKNDEEHAINAPEITDQDNDMKFEVEVFFAKDDSKCKLFMKFLRYIRYKKVFIPLLFSFINNLCPIPYGALFFFMNNELKLDSGQQGVIALCSNVVALLFNLSYNWKLKNLNFKCFVITTSLLSVLSTFGIYWVAEGKIIFGMSDFLTFTIFHTLLVAFKAVSMIPMMNIAAMLCPKNLEAIVFAFFMSIFSLGAFFSDFFAAALISFFKVTANDFDGLPNLILTTMSIQLIPLIYLLFIPKQYLHPVTY